MKPGKWKSKERQRDRAGEEIKAEGTAEGATSASRWECMIRGDDMKVKQTALIQKGKMTDFS